MRGLPWSVLAASVLIHAAAGEPGTPYLVADLAPGRGPSYPDQPRGYVPLGGGLAFAADDPEHGRELWWTDGSSARLLADLDPRPGVGSNPTGMTALGGRVLCFTQSPGMRPRLWSVGTDGSAVELAAFPIVPSWEVPTPVGVAGSLAYFAANDDVHGRELWSTDGTAAGTRMVADLEPGLRGTVPTSAAAWRGSLYIQAAAGMGFGGPGRLWRADADGTISPVSPISSTTQFLSRYGGPMAVFEDRLYFFHSSDDVGGSLWSTDGSAEGTRLERVFWEDPSADLTNKAMAAVGGRLFVGMEWGTLVLDGGGAPGRYLSEGPWGVDTIVGFGDRAMILLSGRPWLSDGTDEGTHAVSPANIVGPVAMDGAAAYFRGPGEEPELWRLRVGAEVAQPITGSLPNPGVVYGASLWTPMDAQAGILDGTLISAATTPDRTVMIAVGPDADRGREIATIHGEAPAGSYVEGVLPLNGGVVFLAVGGEGRTGLWFSDGTGRGTVLLAEYHLNPYSLQYTPIWESDGLVYFLASDGGPWTLQRTDGTVQGTRAIPLVAPDGTELRAAIDSRTQPTDLFIARPRHGNVDREWFVQLDRTTGEPLRIEPLEGTWNNVRDVDRGLHLVGAYDRTSYFDDDTGERTPVLMPEGTSLLGWTAPAGGRVYFLGLTQIGEQYEYAAWVSDGPGVMSRRLLPLASSGQMSFFSAGERAIIMQDAGDGVDVWTTEPDGSAATYLRRFAYFDRNNGFEVAGFGGDAFFVPLDLATGREVWRAGSAGASLLAETMTGPDGAATNLRDLGAFLAFTAPGASGGPELWLSDGTPGGTRSLSAFTGSTRVLDGREAAVSRGLLFLTGSTPEAGDELWAVRLCAPDFTGDGLVDAADYDGFVAGFEAGDRAADFNADGFLDFFDYADFVAAFERGC